MRWVYREIGGKVKAVLVSHKPRIVDPTYDTYGDHVPFHQRMINAYSDLEREGKLTGPLRNSPNKTYVRDVHVRALEEGI